MTMDQRPKIKLELSTADTIFEIVGWFLVIAVWGYTIANYSILPETIPTHYNGEGKADGFGRKSTIFTLPLLATVLFVGMTILNRFPHIFNYPGNITQENVYIQYTNATRLIRYLKLIIVVIFGFIAFLTIQNSKGEANGLGSWFLPFSSGLIFIPLAYYVLRSFKSKQ
jgi:uncharacterized membrane protein